jgi:hypothetical protein
MEMLKVGEYSPSFARMSAAAVEFAIRHGAAKVDNLLPYQSHARLTTRNMASIPSLLAARAPELGYYFDLLSIDDNTTGFDAHTDEVDPGAGIHTDTGIIWGLSLLLPRDIETVIGISNTPFSEADIPDLVWRYGPGDGLILRQALEKVNGQAIDLGQAIHGACRTEAAVVDIIDLHTKHLTYSVPAAV